MRYKLTYRVKGDHIAKDFELTNEYDADSLDELALEGWQDYRKALHYIWKDMESGVFLEPRPNALMSIECHCNDDNCTDEEDVLNAFYRIRMRKIYGQALDLHQKL